MSSKKGDRTPPPAYSDLDCAATNGPYPEKLGDGSEKQEKVALKKNLGLVSGTALIVGTMIGSGIFVSPRGVLEGSGSVCMSLIVWGGCGVLAMLGALSYAELGTAIPKSGGEHAYLLFTFKSLGKFWGPIPAFLFDWLGVFVLRPSMFAIMSLSLGTYATQPFYGQCEAPPFIKKLVTIVAMLLIGFINSFSVNAATKVQNVLTASKLVAAAIITIGGIYNMATGDTEYIAEGFEGTRDDASVLALSFYNGLWAYDGWNNLNFVTEELKNPYRDLPRSIMIGIPLTTIVYVLVNVGYFAVLSKQEILMSDAVAVLWGSRMLGVMAWIIPIFVVLSCFGAANGCLFASGRLCYVAAREGHLPHSLSYIHMRKFTPMPSLMFTVIVGILLILPSDLGSLIGFFSFTAWMFYGLTAATTIILRFTHKDLHRPYKITGCVEVRWFDMPFNHTAGSILSSACSKSGQYINWSYFSFVPIVIPVLVVLASIYLILAPIVKDPRIEFLYAFLFLASGILVYLPFVYGGYNPSWSGRISKYIQILFEVVPPAEN